MTSTTTHTAFNVFLSKAWFYIALTYLLALLPWTVLTSLDFISSDWRTLKATRRSGWYHFFFVVIPIPFIIFYIVVFWTAMEYTESCAAFLALYVSFVHFLRTSWGLWQIYLFRSWAIQAIESMEEMGYEFKIRLPLRSTSISAKRKIKIEDKAEDTTVSVTEDIKDDDIQYKTAEEKADLILVNNTIIDNQMFHGDAQCYLQYREKMYCVEKDPYGERSFFKRWIEGLWITVQLPFLPVMWIFDLARFEIERVWIESNKCRPRVLHLPFKPVDVWLNWSTVFAAQGLNEWMQEFEVATDPDMEEEKIEDEDKLYEARRDYFSGELLAGMSHLNDMKSDMDRKNISMLWEDWDEKSGIRDGTVKKRELLRAACESGRGLPFRAQHIIESDVRRDTVEGLEGGEGFVGYREYKTKLEWVIGSLPVRFGGVIREFDIERLEWLTILLYLGEMKKEVKEKKKREDVDEKGNRYGNENETSTSESDWSDTNDIFREEDWTGSSDGSHCSDGCPDERYMPFRNLMTQLGFSSHQHSISTSSDAQNKTNWSSNERNRLQQVCSFAFNKSFISNICMTISRTNRHALRIGELSDIWIQLEAGTHYKFLQERNEWWRTSCLGTTIQQDMNMECSVGIDADGKVGSSAEHTQRGLVTSSLRTRQKRAELSRLRYQLGDGDQKYWHLEQSLSLMGYRMEFVRSELGHWMTTQHENEHEKDHENNDELGGTWRPKITSIHRANSRNSRSREDTGCRIGLLSSSLSDSITSQKDRKWIERRSVQVRLLWEIQQLLEEQVKTETTNNEGGPGSVVMMMHCILGFPALVVEMDDNEQRTGHARDTQDERREDIGEEEVNVSSDKNGNCMIRFCKKQDIKKQRHTRWSEITENTRQCARQDTRQNERENEGSAIWKIQVRPQCAPQDVVVQVHLEKHASGRVYVTAGIERNTNEEDEEEEEEDERFEWEWWRDSFLSRLQGLAEWQEKHQFPFVRCEGTMDSIAESIEEKQVSEIGCGEKLRTWKGWRPFRLSICRFELETPGYILQDKKTDSTRLEWSSPGPGNIISDFMLNRVEQVAISYDEAGWKELHNCFLAMKDIVEESWEEQNTTIHACDNNNKNKTESERSDLVSVPSKITDLLHNGQEGHERAVLLLRETALKEQDGKSLEHCLRLMSEGLSMERNLGGAIDLLHMFLIYGTDRTTKQDIADRSKLLVDAATKNTKQLWFDKDRRADLFKVLRLVCVRVIGMIEFDDVIMDRLEWLLSMLRVRVMRHRESSTLSFLADAEGDVWNTVVFVSKKAEKTENEGSGQSTSRQVREKMEDVNVYVASCAIYERAIQASQGTAYQSWLLNGYGVQLQFGINDTFTDAPRAVQLFERAIHSGNRRAMNNLGYMLQHGAEGVPKDPQRALSLYQQAIDGGNTLAMNNLAYMLENGAEGVPKDPQRALSLYQQAIDSGHTDAMNNLAHMLEDGAKGVPKDPQRALSLYQQAIDGGDTDAMYNLARMLEKGAEGVPKDPQRALSLYQQAIDSGDTLAMNNLAHMLHHGIGIQVDLYRAKHLYEQAIEKGNEARSMYHLGCLLQNADNVEIQKDAIRAKHLYERAITEENDVDAMFALAQLLESGNDGVASEPERAVELYESLVLDHEHEDALKRISKLLEEGREEPNGLEADGKRALELYEKATEGSLKKIAEEMLGRLLERGGAGVDVDKERAAQLLGDLEDGEERNGENDE